MAVVVYLVMVAGKIVSGLHIDLVRIIDRWRENYGRLFSTLTARDIINVSLCDCKYQLLL